MGVNPGNPAAYPEGAHGVKEYNYGDLLICSIEVKQRTWMVHGVLTLLRLTGLDFCEMFVKGLTSVLVGTRVHENPYVRQLFMGNHMAYDMFKTRFLLMPYVNTNMCYCLYVLDMLTHNLMVYDPHMPPQSKENIAAKHSEKCQRIIDAFAACATSFYNGWLIDTKN